MKYKKTTIIGAALSLALVLGLTAGFASNPAEPGTENGSESQRDYSIEWSLLERSLADWVTKGELTQEKADEILAWAREATEDEEGQRFYWTFDEDCGMVTENGSTFYRYRDKNGDLAKIDSETFVRVFISPMVNNGGSVTVDVEPGEKTPAYDDLDALLKSIYTPVAGQGVFVIANVDTNGNLVVTDEYGMILPESTVMEAYKAVLDRAVLEGNLTPEQAAEWLGKMEDAIEEVRRGEISRLMFNRTNSGPEFAASVGANPVEPAAQSHPVCTAERCTVSEPHWHENGKVVYDSACQAELGVVCDVEGCTNSGHLHHDVRTEDSAGAGSEPAACPPEAIDKTFGPRTCADCGVEGCTVNYLHCHSGGYTFQMGPVCPMEDCATWGCHDHDGVMYSCNGNAHGSGVCDGSCFTYSQPMQSASNGNYSNSGHHSESHGSGHHGSGHH